MRATLRHLLSVAWACMGVAILARADVPGPGWSERASFFILTTPEGADLPSQDSVQNFPLLVRLSGETFDFAKAQSAGEDLRFASQDGQSLAYQIESWNLELGQAWVWVRIPRIEGQARQEVRVFWGNPTARSESSASAVFGDLNDYLSVWHLGATSSDELGTLECKDTGTAKVEGIIGVGRRFPAGQGIFGGDQITRYPTGAAAHSTELWFRAERSNVTLLGWGNEGGGRGSKVRLQLRSPPHLHVDSDFADVDASVPIALHEWVHVVHTYSQGQGRLYVNGVLAGEAHPLLNIRRPARLWLGGWYDDYDFVGDLDEVRISQVARSPAWVRLAYENQKRLPTLVGGIVPKGSEFSVSPTELRVREGQSSEFTAQAGGAQKLYWVLKRSGEEKIVAVDSLHYRFEAGRVTQDEQVILKLRAVYPGEVRVREVPITVVEAVADPDFSLDWPRDWDGRTPLQLEPTLRNRAALKAASGQPLHYQWTLTGPAVIHRTADERLVLERALGSGQLHVSISVDNGGQPVTHTASLEVHNPDSDPWVDRPARDEEHARDGQLYPRDASGLGTVWERGVLAKPAQRVVLQVYEGERLVATEAQEPGPSGRYALNAKLKPGLVTYRVELWVDGERLHHATNVVCGDAILVIGQSNAVATDFGEAEAPTSDWVRTFGANDGDPEAAQAKFWTVAQARSPGGKGEVGYWALDLGRRWVADEKVPIAILNGAVGGTRIDQHQRNADDPTDLNTIYGRLLWRAREAGLTHGIRAVVWHQGENDQGADGPSGKLGWETYREYFHQLAASWKTDYPNLEWMYVFQIWPKACAMGIGPSDNQLREVQRTLGNDFSRLRVLSTLGVRPPGECHFPAAGYAEFARMLAPLMEHDLFHRPHTAALTPPNLQRATFATAQHDTVILEFDQPVVWSPELVRDIHFAPSEARITRGQVDGRQLRLELSAPTSAWQIRYLDSQSWSPDRLLRGTNGLAALTFWDVPIGD